MQTKFTAAQLADSDVAESEQILRKCVHCGFCTATCPTYVLLGDELDSPRGRIYLIKDMLENERPATFDVVRHVDRCLSCLACMTTCPSGVHYQHLIDHARVYVEQTYRRPWPQRAVRAALAAILPFPKRFRAALRLATLAQPFASLLPRRLRNVLELVPGAVPKAAAGTASAAASNELSRAATDASPAGSRKRLRVALLGGCVEPVLAPSIQAAAARLLRLAGAEVVPVTGCCGAVVHHLGRAAANRALAKVLIDELYDQISKRGLDAIVVTASGCGTHAKDYGHLFRSDPELAERAAAVSALVRDVAEVLHDIDLPAPSSPQPLTVAYHSACSMQHGQRVNAQPRALLERAGFTVAEIAEGHLCCGSAGTYNLLQPEIAARLRDRKLAQIDRASADVVATGNIGCITQLAKGDTPIVHTVELLDWAMGGPRPAALSASPEAGSEARNRRA
jgi:glycolate oxidase iron-sulfur subunit